MRQTIAVTRLAFLLFELLAGNCNAPRLRKLRLGCYASFAVCHTSCILLRKLPQLPFIQLPQTRCAPPCSLLHIFVARHGVAITAQIRSQRHTYLATKPTKARKVSFAELRRFTQASFGSKLKKNYCSEMRV